MMNLADYISIDDATRAFNRSRDWFFRKIKEKKLTRYQAEGDRHILMNREEIEKLLTIRPLDGDK